MFNSTIAPRPAFVEAHPEQSAAHLSAQRGMFGAARQAGLSYDRALQIRGMNEALGLRRDARITSRRQLTIAEMQALTVAIEAHLFEDDWTWGNDFTLTIRTRLVEVTEVHFAPVAAVTANDERAFSRLLNS